jgi:hypothetical protein
MPRIAALIPARASENKEMPQRAGVAVIGAPVASISFQVRRMPGLRYRCAGNCGPELGASGGWGVRGHALRGDLGTQTGALFCNQSAKFGFVLIEIKTAAALCGEILPTHPSSLLV